LIHPSKINQLIYDKIIMTIKKKGLLLEVWSKGSGMEGAVCEHMAFSGLFFRRRRRWRRRRS
jgi:hypothetical protein